MATTFQSIAFARFWMSANEACVHNAAVRPVKAFRLNFESPKPCQSYGFFGLLAIRWLRLKAESYNDGDSRGNDISRRYAQALRQLHIAVLVSILPMTGSRTIFSAPMRCAIASTRARPAISLARRGGWPKLIRSTRRRDGPGADADPECAAEQRTLFLAAFIATRHDPNVKTFRERPQKAAKHPKSPLPLLFRRGQLRRWFHCPRNAHRNAQQGWHQQQRQQRR